MELFKFTRLVKELCDYYEKKEPKQDTIELWFQKVGRIPDETVQYIVSDIEGGNDIFPRNLPNAIWHGYRNWLEINKDRLAVKEYFECPDCDDGYIWASMKHEDVRRIEYVFQCGKCRQETNPNIPTKTRVELVSQYQEVRPKGGKKIEHFEGKRPVKNVADMAKMIKNLNNRYQQQRFERADS